MSAIPAIRAAWSGLAARFLQTAVIGLVVLAATAASALAVGMIVETNAPFDHAFAKDHGAQVAVTAGTSKASPAELAATTRLPGVTAAAGPFPETVATAQIGLAWRRRDPQAGGAADRARIADRAGGRPHHRRGPLGADDRRSRLVSRPDRPAARARADDHGDRRARIIAADGRRHRDLGHEHLGSLGGARRNHPAAPCGPGRARLRADALPVLQRGSAAAVSADIAAVRAALPPGALLGTPQSYLTAAQQASASIAPWVPFIVAFGVIALVMSVLIVINVISGAVVGGTRRIGVLKSIGFTPLDVVAAYVLQVAIPALAGCALGAACGDLLSEPLLNLNGQVYGLGVLFMPFWVVVVVPLAMLALTCAAATVPALRAGRMNAVQAISSGRAPRAAHGYLAHRLLGRLEWMPRTLTLGLAAPFARQARTFVTLAAVLFGAVAVTFGVGLGASLSRAAADLSLAHSEPVQVSPDAGSLARAQQQTIMSALNSEPGTLRYVAETDDQLTVGGLSSPVSITSYAGQARWTGWSMITGSWYSGPGEADVNTYFLTATGTKVGGSYTFTSGGRQTTVRIVGEVFKTGSTAAAFMSSSTLAAIAPGLAPDQYDVAVRAGTAVQSYANALSARLGSSLSVSTNADSPVFSSVLVLVAVLTVLLMVVAGLGVLNTVMLQIRERAHDLGVFKAIGMVPRQALVMTVWSVTGVGFVAGIMAVPACVALHHFVIPVMAHAAQSDVPGSLLSVYTPRELVLLALSGLLIAAAGALVPASRVARIRTATALRAE